MQPSRAQSVPADFAIINAGTVPHPALARPGVIAVVRGELAEFDPKTAAALARFDHGFAGRTALDGRRLKRARRLARAGASVVLIECAEPWRWRDAVEGVQRMRWTQAGGRWWAARLGLDRKTAG